MRLRLFCPIDASREVIAWHSHEEKRRVGELEKNRRHLNCNRSDGKCRGELVQQIHVSIAVVAGSIVRIRAIDVPEKPLQRHELLNDLLEILVRVFALRSQQTSSLREDAVVDHQAPKRASLNGSSVDELDVFQTGQKHHLVDGGDDLVDYEIGGGEVQQAVSQSVQLDQGVVALDAALHPGTWGNRVPVDTMEVRHEGVWVFITEIDRPNVGVEDHMHPSRRADGVEEIGTAHQQVMWYCEHFLIRGRSYDNVEGLDVM